jgi:glycosyltransferase involved in cell wall biosynthesis
VDLKSIDQLTAERDELNRQVAELLEFKRQQCERIQEMEAGADLAQIEIIKADRDALQEQVKELEKIKDWLFEIWKGCEFELDQIHSSKMWRVWMAYIAIRRLLLKPFRLVLELPSLVRKVFVLFARFGGACYLKTSASIRRARAWLRRRRPRHGRDSAPSTTHKLAEGSRPRLLLVTPYQVYPANHGGGVRLINLVQRLSERCDLFLLVFSTRGEDPDQREALDPYTVRLDFHRWVPKHRPGLFGLKPPNAQLFSSERVSELIRDIVLGNQIDIVQLEYAELGQYASSVPDGVPVILTEHDIAFRTQQRRRELRFMDRYPDSKVYCNTRTDLDRIFLHELRVCREADRIHVMSEADGDFLASFLPDGWKRIRVAPNGVDCTKLAPPPENPGREGVLYVGNFQNLPNVDALEYLVNDVWPLLRLNRPDATLTVVGAHAEGRVTHFDGQNGVEIVGEVPEIRPYYHSHRVLAAPIRAASGTRLKILEAFAAGIPVVSTTVGAEGIAYEDGKHLVIADSAMKFAEALERLLNDDRQTDILTREGRKLAEQRYDWKRVSEVVLADYVDLLDTSRRSGEPRRRVGGTPEPRSPTAHAGRSRIRLGSTRARTARTSRLSSQP